MAELDDLLPRELQQRIESRMKRESPLVYAQWANGFTSLTAAFRETLDGMEQRHSEWVENTASDNLNVEIELADVSWRGIAVTFGYPEKEIIEAKRRRDALHAKADERNARLMEKRRKWQVMSVCNQTQS